MSTTATADLTIQKVTFTERQVVAGETRKYSYSGYALRGRIAGHRIRRQFKTYGEAQTEKDRLEVEAADRDGAIKAVPTWLTPEQVRAAEIATARLAERSLPDAIDWYLAN